MLIKKQVIASTNLDSHGERFTKAELERWAAGAPRRMPIHVMHDMEQPISGVITNISVVPNDSTEEWQIVGDIETDDIRLGVEFKGFSISLFSPIYENPNSKLKIALPYPAYNDATLINSLTKIGEFDISKWRKKADTTTVVAVVLMFAQVVLTPFSEDLYNTYIRSALRSFRKSALGLLGSREIPVELCQRIEFANRIIELRFLPDDNTQPIILDDQLLLSSILQSKELLEEHRFSVRKIARLVFKFDRIGRRFVVLRTEFDDGSNVSGEPSI